MSSTSQCSIKKLGKQEKDLAFLVLSLQASATYGQKERTMPVLADCVFLLSAFHFVGLSCLLPPAYTI